MAAWYHCLQAHHDGGVIQRHMSWLNGDYNAALKVLAIPPYPKNSSRGPLGKEEFMVLNYIEARQLREMTEAFISTRSPRQYRHTDQGSKASFSVNEL